MILSIGKTDFFLFKCTSFTVTQQEKYEQHQQRKIDIIVCQS